MSKIWLTSDLHFCHNRGFIYEPRGFNSIDEHNKTIVSNWNKVVSEDDDVYVLGDLMLNDNETACEYIKQLNGRIHIVRGNHDTDTRWAIYMSLPNVVELCSGWATMIHYRKYHFYLSHFPTLTGNLDQNEPIIQRIINLCGHAHSQNCFEDWDKGMCYHVELDCHNNTPICLDKIIEDIKNYIHLDKEVQMDIIEK